MNKKIKASFTVEASFVMSIVLFTIIFIIYLSFYLHDYSVMKGITDGVLYKSTLYLKHEADIGTGKVDYDKICKGIFSQVFGKVDAQECEIENHLSYLLSNRLLVTRISDVSVSKGILNISIRVEGTIHIPIKGVQRIFSGDRALVVEVKAPYHKPANSVRISEVILDTGSKIKGYNKLKETVEKLTPK